jgi:phage/plasmid-like protein (TIGR03299 family)
MKGKNKMAHEIENMAYVGTTPWHGLGIQLDNNQPLETWAIKAGMNFRIMETPVRYAVGRSDDPHVTLPFVEQKVLYRSDTKAALSVVSSRYMVVQPREILEFYGDLIAMSGFELETAGVMKAGKKIWALARTGQSTSLKGSDTVNGYLLLATACDGSLATTAQFTSVRVVCNNTLAIALDGGTGAVKVPHSTTFDPQAVKKQLGVSVSAWDQFRYQMKELSERKVKSNEVERFLNRVFVGIIDKQGTPGMERTMQKVKVLYEGKGRGAELDSSKGTAFGLLNAVTQYIDHERRARSVDHRLESAWFGQGAILKQKAFDQTMLMLA